MDRKSKFVIFKGRSTRTWYWHLVGANGEIMAQSEGYTHRWSAARGAKRFATLAANASTEVRIIKK